MNQYNNPITKKYFRYMVESKKTEKERSKEFHFAAVLGGLILLPVVVLPILLTLEFYPAALLFLVADIGTFAILGISNRRRVIRKFYRIKDGHTYFQIIHLNSNAQDLQTLRELHDKSAMTFQGELSREWLDFLYNWLFREGVLREGEINLYCFSGEILKQAYPNAGFEAGQLFMSIHLTDLSVNWKEQTEFAAKSMYIGARWMDDMVK